MNWLNYHHLLYFWAVAKEGSLRRAGEKLHISQPTISAQIRQLEEVLGEQVLAHEPSTSAFRLKTLNYRLEKSGVVLCASARLAAKLRRTFPLSLNGAPAVLPTMEMPLR